MHFVKRKTFHNVKTKLTRKPRINTSPPSQSREGGVPGLQGETQKSGQRTARGEQLWK